MKNKKVNEIFYRVFMNDSFQKSILDARKKLNIPVSGFNNQEEVNDWWHNADTSLLKKYDSSVSKILRSHKLPLTYFGFFENSLFLNQPTGKFNENILCNFTIKKDAGVNRLHIIANPYTTIDDLLKYIEENRKVIKESLNKIRGNFPKTTQSFLYKDRDKFIYQLSLKPKADLKGLVENGSKKYKEKIIAELVKNRFGSNLSEETIKSVIKKQKKIRKG